MPGDYPSLDKMYEDYLRHRFIPALVKQFCVTEAEKKNLRVPQGGLHQTIIDSLGLVHYTNLSELPLVDHLHQRTLDPLSMAKKIVAGPSLEILSSPSVRPLVIDCALVFALR